MLRSRARLRLAATIALAVCALGCLGAGSASAAGPDAPSRAAVLQFGLPFSGSTSTPGPYQWFHPPALILPADRLQFTIENDGGASTGADVRVCLAPAVDDFGQQDTEAGCDTPGYTSKYPNVDVDPGKFRRTLKWTGAATPGFLLLTSGCGACESKGVNYAITLEKQIHVVRVGGLVVRKRRGVWAVAAPARLADNSPLPPGHRGHLEIRYDGGKTHSTASVPNANSAFRFRFKPPRKARKASLRICTTAVGSGEAMCSARTRVRVGPRHRRR